MTKSHHSSSEREREGQPSLLFEERNGEEGWDYNIVFSWRSETAISTKVVYVVVVVVVVFAILVDLANLVILEMGSWILVLG